MSERIKAWQCAGCGRIESQATCIGVCSDRPVHVVSAADYDALRAEMDGLRLFLRRLTLTSPRAGEWQKSYEALQARARELLA